MMSSTAKLEALKSRQRPEWYDNAKLGIFIHWGVFSVPAWAPYGEDYQTLIKKKGYRYQIAHNPYAEWYPNTMKIKGSPSRQHHVKTYGEDFSYYDFIPTFVEESARMDVESWADLFHRAGARYVVMVTKHHDGYTLWPTDHKNSKRTGMHSERDFVGEVTEAVRAKSLRMGYYYSGGLDWTFKETAISDPYTFLTNTPQQAEYVAYTNNHMRELIDRYKPSILWNDIRYPKNTDLVELFSDYYAAVPDGLINDRWNQGTIPEGWFMRVFVNTIGWFHAKLASSQVDAPGIHYDYVTPEYVTFDRISRKKWEACRGLGTSFGYNRNEPDDNLLTNEELIHSFVDIVSKNGNLLINVGPMADGTIPDVQRERLVELGGWLAVNGDAIYDTRPWITAAGRTTDGKDLRFTQKEDALFAVVLDSLTGGEISLESFECAPETKVSLLGHDKPLSWSQDAGRVTITLPDQLPASLAHAFKIVPQPVGQPH
jgi:alpha-L-fucosidase